MMPEDREQRSAGIPDVAIEDVGPFVSAGEPPAPPIGEPAPAGQEKPKSTLREWVESLVFTIIFVLIFTRFIAQATQVPTESMKPTIMVGDHFFLDKVAFPANYPEFVRPYLPERSVDRGDIVAFRAPTDGNIPFVKRIIGVPGDVVEIRDKTVLVNGRALDEPYKIHVDGSVYGDAPWTPDEIRIRDNYGPVTLPEDSFFAMGDNRDNSNDSRYWGFVRQDDIIGKPLFIYWSYESDPYMPGRRSFRDRIEDYVSVAVNFFGRTRWFRIGTMVE